MARFTGTVLLLVLAIVCCSAQTGSFKAIARGGFQYLGNDGEATGAISGEIRSGKNSFADFMFVLKDPGGATRDGQGEAVVFLKSVSRSVLTGNRLVVTGRGTFQGATQEIEVTFIDGLRRSEIDQVRVRVLRSGQVLFDQSARLAFDAVTISRQ
ncbi:MAG: hypothetical protein H7Y17_03015 [Chlorobia bacterium]|nr:hypothetical protein [Fimbriimonadaceae bacterium]